MVQDRLDDGHRIAQLLASELTGLREGPLESVAVTDAESSVEPAEDGTVAYRVSHEGRNVARTLVTPDAAVVKLASSGTDRPLSTDDPRPPERDDLSLRPPDANRPAAIRIESGAAVKPAVDAIRAWLTDRPE